MTETKTILLVQDGDFNVNLYIKGINERNEISGKQNYTIVDVVTAVSEAQRKLTEKTYDVIFIDYRLSDLTTESFIKDMLNNNPQLKVLVTCIPKDVKDTAFLSVWNNDYPMAVIGRIIKPFQPSAIWSFLDSCEYAVPLFDFEWEEDWGN